MPIRDSEMNSAECIAASKKMQKGKEIEKFDVKILQIISGTNL